MGTTPSSVPVGPAALTKEEEAAALAARAPCADSSKPRILLENRTTWACRAEVSLGSRPAQRVHLCSLEARGGQGEPFVPHDPLGPWRVRFVSGEARDGDSPIVLDELDVVCGVGDVRVIISEVPGGAEVARLEYVGAAARGLAP